MIIRMALWPALCALGTGAACAHAATIDAAPSEGSGSRPIEYRSVFDDYRAYREPTISDWRTSNETVGRLKGHAGHSRASNPESHHESPRAGDTHLPREGAR